MTLINMKHKNPNQMGMVFNSPDLSKEKIAEVETDDDNNHTKQTQMVPWSECAPLIDKLKELTGWGHAQILQEAGYSAESNYEKWAKAGAAAKRVKMALLGMLYSLGYSTEPVFTHDELADLFVITTGRTIPNAHRRKLLTKIAEEMSRALTESRDDKP